MERIVRRITDRLAEKLPTGREFYTPEDLQVLDIPEFITDRLIIEMNQNLSESLLPPETEWASMDEASVRFAWKNFLEAIRAEVRMPAVYARSLFETAVADTLELAVKPRVAIPETLFGVDELLTVDVLKKRVRYITVGRKLAAALVRYMEKKNRESLSIDECRNIITRVDEKLMSGNNSLDWAKELDALFNLAGPSVDAELLRIYFADKGEDELSDRFDRHTGSVDRNEMIEIIASPGGHMAADYTPVPAPESEPETEESPFPKPAPKKAEATPVKKKPEKEEPEADSGDEEEAPENSILAAFQKKRVVKDDEEEYYEEPNSPESSSPLIDQDEPVLDEDNIEEDETPIWSRFGGAEDEDELLKTDNEEHASIDEESEEEQQGRLELDGDLLQKWRNIGGLKADEDEPVLEETDKPEDDEEIDSIELYNETTDDEEVPMWRAFLDREDLSKVKDESEEHPTASEMQAELDDKNSAGDDENRGRSISEMFGDDNEEEWEKTPTGPDHRVMLENWMEQERARFITHIFDGSKTDYRLALEQISKIESWKRASAYISNDIFESRDVDVFDEVAVDFTDRLHTFFLENKSK